MTTALQVVKDALGVLAIPAPLTLLNENDDQSRQAASILKEVCDYMVKKCSWPRLTVEKLITTTAVENQGDLYELCPNFRRIIKHSMFNRTQGWRIHGPTDAEQWQRAKTGAIWLDTGRHWRQIGDNLYIYGNTTAGDTVAFEYLSKNWIKKYQSTERADRVSHDEDEVLLEDSVVQLGFQARWLHANGLEYLAKNAAFEAALRVRIGEETAADKVSLDHPRRQVVDPLYPYDVHVKVN